MATTEHLDASTAVSSRPEGVSEPRTLSDTELTCPRCGCQLIGIEKPCPEPSAHLPRMLRGLEPPRVYGAQLRTSYRVDGSGMVWVPFRRWDGVIREYPCYWPWRDPGTGEELPWMIVQAMLGRVDLDFVTGLSPSAFNAASAGFPGRIAGTRRVVVETTTFLREYIFGNMTRQRRWRRTTRPEKKARHRTDCRKGCRKRHC